jgi:hypothetical protein
MNWIHWRFNINSNMALNDMLEKIQLIHIASLPLAFSLAHAFAIFNVSRKNNRIISLRTLYIFELQLPRLYLKSF